MDSVDKAKLGPLHPNVSVSNHPILSHKTAILRSVTTDASLFRSTLRSITFHLGYEATSSLLTKPVSLTMEGSDVLPVDGVRLTEKVCLIPILRSGLGMVEPLLDLLPHADVHHIGMYKSKETTNPVLYYQRLPKKCCSDVAYVLDPLVASAGTLKSVVGILKKWGVPSIHVISVIGSRPGIDTLLAAHPDIHVTLACVDPYLKDGKIVPGLGDVGDRLFGITTLADENTATEEEENAEADERLVCPSKRKMSDL